MGKSREVQDFLAGFTAGFKMMDDSIYKQALSEYYRGGGKGGRQNRYGLSGSSGSKEPNFFQRLFGGEEEKKFANPAEQGLDFLRQQRVQAVSEGNVAAVKKIDADILDHAKMHGMGGPSSSAPASRTPSAPRMAIPEKPSASASPSANSPAGDGGGANGGAPLGGTVKQYPSETAPVESLFQKSSFETDAAEPKMEAATLMQDDTPALALPDPEEDMYYAAEGGYIDLPQSAFDEEPDEEADLTVTQRMADAAAPGVDAGLRLMQARFTSPAGLPDEDPNTQAGVQAFAQNEGAASDEEVDAINRVVDPEGKLPKSALSAARIAAVTSFYKDDPEKAADLANRLLLHDKRNAQTLGQLALNALQDGKPEIAARFVRDGFNNTVPGGGMIQKADLRDDGNFNVSVRTPDGPQNIVATPEMIQQAAASMANGSGWTQEVINQAARSKAAVEKPKAARGVAVDAEVAEGYMNAKLALRRAMQSNDPEAIKQAQAAVNAAEEQAIAFASKQKNPAQTMRAMGINPTAPAPKPPTPPKDPKVNLTKEERAELRDQQRIGALNKFMDNADQLEQSGVSIVKEGPRMGQAIPADGSRRVSEATRVEEARRSIEPIRNSLERERAAIAYEKAPITGKKDTTYDERSGGDSALAENIAGFVRAKMQKEGDRLVMDPTQQREFARVADRVLRKNDVDPGQVVEFLWGAQNDLSKPVKVDRRTGQVQYGNTKLVVDSDTLTEIAAARGRKLQEAIGDRNKKWNEETDAYWKREQDALLRDYASTRGREILSTQTKPRQSEEPKDQLRERGIPVGDYKSREREARRRRDAEDDAIPSR